MDFSTIQNDDLRRFLSGMTNADGVSPWTSDKELIRLLDILLAEAEPQGVVVLRDWLTRFNTALASAHVDTASEIAVLDTLLDKTAGRAQALERVIQTSRERLGTLYEARRDWVAAARVLQGISLETGQGVVSPNDKVQIYTRIARCYLSANDLGQAETFAKRAANYLFVDTTPAALQREYRLVQADILNAQCKFLEAFRKYYDVSLLKEEEWNSDRAFQQAIKCAVLAGVGNQRTQALATLCDDPRTAMTPYAEWLNRLYQVRYIPPTKYSELKGMMHHLMSTYTTENLTTDDTLVTNALIEHNLVALSRVYATVTVDRLAVVLGNLSVDQTALLVSRLITQGALRAGIDDTQGVVYFDTLDQVAKGMFPDTGEPQRQNRTALQRACEKVDVLAEEIQRCWPQLARQV
ncbi:hypothetical protein IWQ62_001435 [Dispira parvispora]|uniref:COP9 signalosome complex subunit 4 n=1 Tax=Dispira parvispora TaxID=1520584 RepID=A0A9W8ASK1_9FUNG|nr:hypothetical protein IWQ62_001435 [Dispira parvispora]